MSSSTKIPLREILNKFYDYIFGNPMPLTQLPNHIFHNPETYLS